MIAAQKDIEMKFILATIFAIGFFQICTAQNLAMPRFIVDVVSFAGESLNETNFYVLCKGTIVNNLRHVLTPASCVQPHLNPLRVGIIGRVTVNATFEQRHYSEFISYIMILKVFILKK